MGQNHKRSLRERRVPKNFDSDNEEGDPWGYSKPTYSKESKNPTQQLNADAKLFLRFINNINKNYREAEVENKKKEVENIKEPLPIRQRKTKNAETIVQSQRKANDLQRQNKFETIKKTKEMQHRPQNNPLDYEILLKNEMMLNRYKTMNIQSANKMMDIQQSLGRNKQLSIDQNRIKMEKMHLQNKVGEVNRPKQNTFQLHVKNDVSQTKTESKNVFYNYDKEKQNKINQIEQKLGIPKPLNSENKIFKRSAYHVAIAYFIYINKRKEKNLMTNDIDPTYYARKLKEDMNRSN